ncbi:MAG: 50S ribosomal protein L22 [Acidimicrobiia bacterium]|nr:50S ribosomal protein L22 [Acidimicrobiia bacterium]
MTGPKLNEAPVRVSGHRRVRVAEETSAFRAKGRYLRVSAYKVREVLDLIRGLDAERARETLRLSDRDAADVVDKVLASAIANAEHHHEHPVDGEELYVSACYADEGPTLKRWRPRARGRATRIRKRTCHITVIVSRLPDEELRERRARQPGAGDRRRRTAASKRAAARKQAAPTAEEEAAPVEDAAPVEEQEEGAPVEDEAPVEQEEAAPVEEQEGAASEQEADAAPEAGQEEEEK